MGGHIAMMLAAHHPERVSRLVMIEAGLGGGDPGDLEGLATWLRSWPVPFAAREDFLAFFGGSRSVAEGWADGLEKRADGLWPQWDAEVLVRAISGVFDHEHLEEWSAVHAPVLLVRGEHGSVPERQIESMCALRPSTELAVIAGAGHDVHLETPEALTPLLQRFLAQP
jgi:pimeloyl-ACP methyl ester carboxylesterase